MRIAQSLYEGIEINGETVGLITYMRTDSVNLSDSATQQIRVMIQNKYGDKYVPEQPNKFNKKSTTAQEAHEAIRPTDISKLPEDIKSFLDERQRRLYELNFKCLS